MPTITSSVAGKPPCALLLGTAALTAALLGVAVAGGGPPAAASTGSTSTTVVTVPPAVRTELKDAQADLAKLDAVIGGEEKQQKAAQAELATVEKDVKDGQLGAAGPDEVSAAIARLFSSHAQEYAALAAQASAFHEQFMQALAAAGSVYAATEAATATP